VPSLTPLFDDAPSAAARSQSGRPTTPLVERLAALFQANPGCWIDGRELARVAGYAAWRTRISDLRRPPFSLVIENRQRRGEAFTVSEYRLRRSSTSSGHQEAGS
jgi:hypothetical protein